MKTTRSLLLVVLLLWSTLFLPTFGFSTVDSFGPKIFDIESPRRFPPQHHPITKQKYYVTTAFPNRLRASSNDDNNNSNMLMATSDQLVLGMGGTIAALVMMYSEFVLSQTGCGLPAGPFGLVGAVEGLSYLSVVGLGGYSLYQKITTGSGLPAGKYGLLGLAEGLAFLALFAGIVVLGLQITNFGYIPNAVPMEGGMCQ